MVKIERKGNGDLWDLLDYGDEFPLGLWALGGESWLFVFDLTDSGRGKDLLDYGDGFLLELRASEEGAGYSDPGSGKYFLDRQGILFG